MADFNYEENRDIRLENEIFFRINPKYPQYTASISLIVAGDVSGEGPSGSSFDVDLDSIRSRTYTVRGVGFPLAEYEDSLRNCKEVWIPVGNGDEEIRFAIKKRTTYRNWIYLWNYESDNSASISGSIIADSFELAEDPYTQYPGGREELDYTCAITESNRSIIFVPYEPNNFRYNGTYNATLNNAISESQENLYTISASVKYKNIVSDYHKITGGRCAGEINVDQGTDKEYVRVQSFVDDFKSRAKKYGDDIGLQTLDLAFTSFRAISASIYVDRINTGSNSASVEKVWEDIQEGNTDDPETVYFIPRCQLDESGSILPTHTTSIPTKGDLIFTVNQHTPVRYIEATLYAPFLNRVYRTDKFGAVVEEFPESDFIHPEEQ